MGMESWSSDGNTVEGVVWTCFDPLLSARGILWNHNIALLGEDL